jgi:enoyl-CoA hydratase/carnithine racemase
VSRAPQLKRNQLTVEGATAILALAGDKVNALDREVLEEITAFVEYCETDSQITALVLTGDGKFFSAGLNVSEILDNDPGYANVVLDALTTALLRLLRCPLPTVAAVNGAAIAGGCLLPLACDRRLIADDARMGVTELKVGVAFPVATVELLRHVCGPHAEDLIFGAGLVDAAEACRVGLAHEQLPLGELRLAAVAAAERLASLDTRAYALAKQSTRRRLLESLEDEQARAIDRKVRDQWQDDLTRQKLGQLLKPKS